MDARARRLPRLSALLLVLLLAAPGASAWAKEDHNRLSGVVAQYKDPNTFPTALDSVTLSGDTPFTEAVDSRTCEADKDIPVPETITAGKMLEDYADWPDDLDPEIADVLKAEGVELGNLLVGTAGGGAAGGPPGALLGLLAALVVNSFHCNPPVTAAQQYRHAYFVDRQGSYEGWGSAPDEARHFYDLARAYVEAGDARRGFLYLALALHYVEDMGVPYHTGYDVVHATLGHLHLNCGDAANMCAQSGPHDRFEARPFTMPEATSLDPPGRLAQPEDYAKHLAAYSHNQGNSLASAFALMDSGNATQAAAGQAQLNATSEELLQASAEYAVAFVEHFFTDLPDLVASADKPNGDSIVLHLQNLGELGASHFTVRLQRTTCEGWWVFCKDRTTVLTEQEVELSSGEARAVTFTLPSSIPKNSRLSIVTDALPTHRSTCGVQTGCILERRETVMFGAAAPAPAPLVIRLPLADLAVASTRIRQVQGAVLVDVANAGDADATAFVVSVYSRDPTGAIRLAGTQSVPSLVAGAALTVPVTTSGTVTSPLVRVDEAGDVAEEEDFANNQADLGLWTVQGNTVYRGAALRPAGDIDVPAGATLRVEDSSLLLAPGAHLSAAPGSRLELIRTTVGNQASAGTASIEAAGTFLSDGSTFAAVAGGVRLAGASTVRGTTLRSVADAPALVAAAGTTDLVSSRFDHGAGGGLLVLPEARASSSGSRFDSNAGTAVEVQGGILDSQGDAITGSPTGLLITGGAGVSAESLSIQSTATGVNVESGTLEATGLQVAATSVAIAGVTGVVTAEDSDVAAPQALQASGTLDVSFANSDLGSSRSVTGSAVLEVDWPLDLRALGPGPDLVPLKGADLEVRDASGATVWHGIADADGRAGTSLRQLRQTSSGVASDSYTVVSRYNGASAAQPLTLNHAVTLTVQPPVVPDVAVLVAGPSYRTGEDRLEAYVVNLQPARVPSAGVQFLVDGATVATPTLPALAPYGIASVSIPRPAGTGIHGLQVRADPSNALAEVDEANNVLSTQSWVVTGGETCTGQASTLAGTLLVLPGGDLALDGCSVGLGAERSSSQVRIEAGGLLRLTDGARLAPATVGDTYGIVVKGGLQAADSELSGMQSIRLESDGLSIDRSVLRSDAPAIVQSTGHSFAIRDSDLFGGPQTLAVDATGGNPTLTGDTFEGFGQGAIRLTDVATATVQDDVFRASAYAVSFTGSSLTVADSTVEPSVDEAFRVFGSQLTLLDVQHDFSTVWQDTASAVTVAWHGEVGVAGAGGAPVPGVTITVIDREGHWLGQFTTGADGYARMAVPEFIATDATGDGKADLPSELRRLDPYTFQSGGREVVSAVTGNVHVVLTQAYAVAATTDFPHLQPAAGSTVPYPVKVRNDGNGEDTVALSLANVSPGWSATVSPATLTLAPGERGEATVQLTAPPVNGQSGALDVTATSEDGAATSTVHLTATTAPNVLPTAHLTATPATVFVGEPVQFQDRSTDADGTIIGVAWSFGDGDSAAGPTASHAYAAVGSYTAQVAARDNAGAIATATQAIQVLNRPPVLSDGGSDTVSGPAGAPVRFAVTVADREGDVPAQVRVRVDGVWHDLSPPSGTLDAAAGIRYAATVSGLAAGTHAYRFEATDPAGASALFPAGFDLSGPLLDDAPELASGSVSPSTGSPSTLFTYTVTYRDANDHPPAFLNVVVDGVAHPLAKASTSQAYSTGVVYSTQLTHAALGTLDYRFEASDGLLAAATDAAAGPTVQGAVVLSDASVDPPMAAPGTVFSFVAMYRDPAGQAPTQMDLVLDGVAHPMDAPASPDYVGGAAFAASVPLSAGTAHSYHVEATKGGQSVRLPATGEFPGPVVNRAPLARLDATASGTVVTAFSADPTASSDAETPANKLEVRMDWGDGTVTPWSKSGVRTHQFARPGDYVVRLTVRDAAGATAQDSRGVTVVATAPTAAFATYPSTGIAEEGDGLGTVFVFQPGMSGDLEDGWDALQARWDWQDDGSWDTPWVGLGTHANHAYTQGGTYTVRLEVRDSTGLTGTATGTVTVDGTRLLDLGATAHDAMAAVNAKHDYLVEVPANQANVIATLTVPTVPGANLDLYLQKDSRPNPSACSPPVCRSSKSLASGGQEQICVRLPAGGSWHVLVQAKSVPSSGSVPYDLVVRSPVLEPSVAVVQCLASG